MNDPVAPEVDAGGGEHVLVHVGIAQHVEPMAGVAHAVLFAGEQMVHGLFVSLRGRVLEKSVLFGGRRRQANEIQIDAAQQSALVRRAGGREPLLPILGGDESINGIGGLGYACGDFGANDRLENPEFFGRLVRRRADGY